MSNKLFFSKCAGALLGVCVLSVGASAQNKKAFVQAALKKPQLKVAEAFLPPLRQAGQLPAFASVLEKNLLFSLENAAQRDMASQLLEQASQLHQLEQQAELAIQQETAHIAYKEDGLPDTRLDAITQYVAKHHVWPSYAPNNDEAWRALTNSALFISVQTPTPDVLALQQQLIRLWQVSSPRTPRQLIQEANYFMQTQQRIPARAYLLARQHYSPEELALGEDLFFAIYAANVPMPGNPFAAEPELAELFDKITTYNAMRRVTPLEEGLPAYAEDGKTANFPIWTQNEFLTQKQQFAAEHPFEYALVSFRENYFSGRLADVFNYLSKPEQTAFMFNAPTLGGRLEVTPIQLDQAVGALVAQTGRKPQSRVAGGYENTLVYLLRVGHSTDTRVFFTNEMRELVPFYALSYPEQLEVLMWAWQTHQVRPEITLQVLAK